MLSNSCSLDILQKLFRTALSIRYSAFNVYYIPRYFSIFAISSLVCTWCLCIVALCDLHVSCCNLSVINWRIKDLYIYNCAIRTAIAAFNNHLYSVGHNSIFKIVFYFQNRKYYFILYFQNTFENYFRKVFSKYFQKVFWIIQNTFQNTFQNNFSKILFKYTQFKFRLS